jgi:hypothetical protein
MMMDFMVNLDVKKLPIPLTYEDRILLVGSCFTEHIGNALEAARFQVLQNPHGILFDPASVGNSLISYIENKKYQKSDLFQLNEVWHSWEHHSRFSQIDPEKAIEVINESQERAHQFLKEASWVVVTLGSAFQYRLNEASEHGSEQSFSTGKAVANCHRAPGQWFYKHLLGIEEIISVLDGCYHRLMQFNPRIKILFTISPVRHLRDGVIENNRSKARLIEAVHHLAGKYEGIFYFPAYELVIDVLRDYRFYDIDLAHPNYMATEFVLEKFSSACIDDTSRKLMAEIRKVAIARNHKAFQPETSAHRQFMQDHLDKVKQLKEKYPFLDLKEELLYFSKT